MRLLSLLSLSLLLALGGCDEATGPESGQARIEIEPRGAELLVGDSVLFRFKFYDGRGREQPISATDEDGFDTIEWWRNPHEGSLSIINGFPYNEPTYTLHAKGPGKSWLTLDYLGLRDSVEVEVGTHPDVSLVSIFAGEYSSCGLDAEGKAHCWGGGHGWSHRPLQGGRSYSELFLGRAAECGITPEREAYCWSGAGPMRGVGPDGPMDHLPRPISGGHRFTLLTSGTYHVCGLAEDGVAYCWGAHDYGQLGLGKPVKHCDFNSFRYCSSTPAPVIGGHRFRALAAGVWHTCGVTLEYELYCWGLNTDDQFATDSPEACPDILYGEVSCSPTPVRIPDAPPLDTLVAGGSHTCGLTPTGEAYCWGHNGYGELGNGGQPENSTVPVPVAGGHRFVMLTHRCGLTATGEVYCWGSPGGGAGYGTEDCWHGRDLVRCNPVPVPQQGGMRFQTINSTVAHTCGIAIDGLPYCWGRNGGGQLGNGDRLEQRPSAVPIRVHGTK